MLETQSLAASSLLPFVPAQDYVLSQAFYQALGFQSGYQDAQLTHFSLGDCAFYLQNFYLEALAQNFVLQLLVPDLDAWWERLQTQKLAENYPIRLLPPETKPWGQRVLTLLDPSGVLWYIAQN